MLLQPFEYYRVPTYDTLRACSNAGGPAWSGPPRLESQLEKQRHHKVATTLLLEKHQTAVPNCLF